MIISNYNSERAENSKRKNDATIKKIHKFERTAFCVKSILLIIMNLCIIAMSFCILGLMFFHGENMSNTMLFSMVVVVAISMVTVVLLMPKRKHPLTPNDYYDNIETKYHRLLATYKNVVFKLNDKNDIVCICEDYNRIVTASTLQPRFVKKSSEIAQPVLDVEHNCLWLPN